MNGLVSINGEVFHPEKAKISYSTEAFSKANIFEVFVAFDNTILDAKEHLKDLEKFWKST